MPARAARARAGTGRAVLRRTRVGWGDPPRAGAARPAALRGRGIRPERMIGGSADRFGLILIDDGLKADASAWMCHSRPSSCFDGDILTVSWGGASGFSEFACRFWMTFY